jgi:cellulase/cellobiase CelA1
MTIANTGTAAINGWSLQFSFAGNQTISQGWSATWTQSGRAVTAASLSYNGSLPPGASLSLGFNATYSGTNTKPAAFVLNGSSCTTG